MTVTETRVPATCPACGRLTVDNVQHCRHLTPAEWAKKCLVMRCRCGCRYHGQGHYVGEAS